MMVGVLGINHKSADLGLREKLAKACDNQLEEKLLFQEFSYVVVSTCNRTEIYFSSNDLAQTHSVLLHILRFDVSGEFEHKLYSYFHTDCFYHLVKVTSGLDSAILLETEIQGQVKLAYEKAKMTTRLSKELHFMFQKSFKISKFIRSTFKLTRGSPSLEEVTLNKILEHNNNKIEKGILFIGYSDINKKIIDYFVRKNIGPLFLCNRTLHEAPREQVKIIPWSQKGSWKEFSTVIVATKSHDFLLKKEDLNNENSVKLLIDLSVPRNIDPSLNSVDGVSLYNIDELNQWVFENQSIKIYDVEKTLSYIELAIKKQIACFHYKEKAKEKINLSLFA
jgi:glutamyl-tRNA reductase